MILVALSLPEGSEWEVDISFKKIVNNNNKLHTSLAAMFLSKNISC